MGQRKKTLERQREVETILAGLPETPSYELEQWLETDDNIAAVADSFLLVSRKPAVEETVPLQMTMTPADWEAYERGKRAYWGAECKCTFCGEIFHGRYVQGKDGAEIELELSWQPDEWEMDVPGRYRAGNGHSVSCPCCGQWVNVTPKKTLRNGKIFQKVAGELYTDENGYAGILYWLERYQIDREGDAWFDIVPREALVVSKAGELLRFSHRRYSGYGESDLEEWQYRGISTGSVGDIPYYSAEFVGKARNCEVVHWMDRWKDFATLVGTTLEKSGAERVDELYDPMEDNGLLMEQYLRLWLRHPNIENLVRQRWLQLAEELAETPEKELAVHWEEQKPHRMLRLRKEDFRDVIAKHRIGWRVRELIDYRAYCDAVKYLPAKSFMRLQSCFGESMDEMVARACREPYWDLEKIERYLSAQGMCNATGARYLVDYRRTAQSLEALHTARDWWPKDLREAHDRVSFSFWEQKKTPTDLRKGFERIRRNLAGLEWSDGTYSILLPESEEDLVREGKVLQHCVGTYGKAHCTGDGVIFFVRKARRPERSWLTLDIRFTSGAPYEVQLHGYQNELYAKGAKVPARGRAFVDKWKKQVLNPWYQNTMKKKLRKERKTA